MSIQNLALCFGPNLLREENETPEEAAKNSQYQLILQI